MTVDTLPTTIREACEFLAPHDKLNARAEAGREVSKEDAEVLRQRQLTTLRAALSLAGTYFPNEADSPIRNLAIDVANKAAQGKGKPPEKLREEVEGLLVDLELARLLVRVDPQTGKERPPVLVLHAGSLEKKAEIAVAQILMATHPGAAGSYLYDLGMACARVAEEKSRAPSGSHHQLVIGALMAAR